jgi:hypothetical protein
MPYPTSRQGAAKQRNSSNEKMKGGGASPAWISCENHNISLNPTPVTSRFDDEMIAFAHFLRCPLLRSFMLSSSRG